MTLKLIGDPVTVEQSVRDMIRWHQHRAALANAMRTYLGKMPAKKPTVRLKKHLEEFLSSYFSKPVTVWYYAPENWINVIRVKLTIRGATPDADGVTFQVEMDSAYRVDMDRTMMGHGLHEDYARVLEAKLPELHQKCAEFNAALTALRELSKFALATAEQSGGNRTLAIFPLAPLSEFFAYYEIDRH